MSTNTKKSATEKIRARLIQMSHNKKQGTQSFADLARSLGVTPALVSQVRASLRNEGIEIANYDVNKHRGRPVASVE